MTQTTKTTLIEEIKTIIKEANWVTYPQLTRILENRGYEVVGKAQIAAIEEPVVFWGGVSEEFTNAVSELLNSGVFAHVAAPLEFYDFEGLEFKMPIIRKRIEGLETPALFPSVLVYVEGKSVLEQ